MAHREDGPGNLGQIHPAIEWANGDQGWYYCGVRHRKNGPAIEYANGNIEWWVRGKRLQTNDRTDFPNELTAIQNLTPDIGGNSVRIRCRIRRSRHKGKLCFLELEDDLCSVSAILMKSEIINRDIIQRVSYIPFGTLVYVKGIVSRIDVSPIRCSQKDVQIILSEVICIWWLYFHIILMKIIIKLIIYVR